MNEQIKKIKVLDSVNGEIAIKIENSIKEIKGVLDVKFNLDESVITYVLDSWSSDYDVLVAILNLLSDEYNVESEPYFEEVEVEETGEEYVYKNDEDVAEETDEDDGYEEIDEKQVRKKELKYKFIEIGVSLIILITGLILSAFNKTQEVADYFYVVAFSVASYEFIFGTLSSIFKKQFNFSNIALFLGAISSLILGTSLGGAVVMIVYTTVTTLFELFKLDITEKYELDFDFNLKINSKINKVNGIILGSVFVVCLLIAFVLPIFLGNYADNLFDTAKRANAILLIFSLTPSIISIPLSYALVYKHALKYGVLVNGEDTYLNVANVKTVAFLGQKVFVTDSGELKENALGSVLELYDANVLKTVLLSSKTKDSTSKLRKELSISASVSSLDKNGINNEVVALKNLNKNSTVLAVGDTLTDANVTLSLTENDGFNVEIKDGNLKKIPFTVKLLKRFKSIIIQNAVLTLIVKALFSILCGFGLITNLVVAVAPVLVISVLSILNALRNSFEII